MKIRTRWIFTIILCLLIAIPLAACDVSTATPSGTLESKNGVTVEGTFEDGAALEAVEVVCSCLFIRSRLRCVLFTTRNKYSEYG